MEGILSKLQEWVVLYGVNVVGAIVILIIGRWAAMVIRALVRKVLQRNRVDETLISFAASLTYAAMLAFVVIAALAKLGIQTTSFIAVLGAAGLAVGLALQGSLTNFAAGVLMIIFKPFKVGDFIEGGGGTGVVEEIGIFTTALKSPDNKKIIVPNGKLTSDTIVNHSVNNTRQIEIVTRVSYGDDLDKVKKVLEQILAEDERVLKDPAPTVVVLGLGESGINLAVRPWVKTSEYWVVFFDMQETIKKRFDLERITIPFRQQDVHLHKAD